MKRSPMDEPFETSRNHAVDSCMVVNVDLYPDIMIVLWWYLEYMYDVCATIIFYVYIFSKRV